MPKDARYKTVKILIEGGHITTFTQIFDHIPKSTVNSDFGGHYTRFNRLVIDPSDLKLREVYTLAGLFEVEEEALLKLVFNQHSKTKKKKG